jgi:hypothetical protein
VTVGGVTAGEVMRLALVLVNTLFFSLSLTILTSTFCRRQRAAQASALFAMLLVLAPLPLSAATLGSPTGRSLSLLLSPVGSCLLAFDTGYRSAGGWFWGSLLATHLLAWAGLAQAGRLVPRVLSREW